MSNDQHNSLSRILSASLLLLFVYSQVCAQVPQATVTIDATKVENKISPLLYGQFLEHMFEGVKFGLHAELLRDRSFEGPPNAIGLPRYWERYPDDRVDDYALNFVWDSSVSYPTSRHIEFDIADPKTAEHSIRIDAGEGVVSRHGIFQSGIPIRTNATYNGYIWIRAENYIGRVTAALESDSGSGAVYATANLTNLQSDWHKYEFTLTPSHSDPLARFAILFPGHGRVWLDQVSLLPADAAPGQVRRDVFEQIKLLKPAFIRWPGGNVAQDYHWQWGVGPRDSRVTWKNLSWKNEEEPSDFGTDEFVKFSRAVGAEPSITVNVEGRGATVAEAAAWVEYCNASETSKYGAMRAANGDREPFAVKLWEIGNEIWGDWVRGHSDAETYARNFNRYAKAMRAIDPSIKLIAVGDNDMKWNRTVLQTAGMNIDYLAIHHYYGRREMAGDLGNLLARPLHYARFYEQVAQLIREVIPGKQIRLAINEWGLDLTEDRQYSMESALYGARLMNVFERNGDLIGMSAVSDLVNGWPGGIIQANRRGVFVSPIFLVNQLYATYSGSDRLATNVVSPTFDTSKEGKQVPVLDVSVTRTADGRKIFIKAVNTDAKSSITASIKLNGVTVQLNADVYTVQASTTDAFNSFQNPQAISIRQTSLNANRNLTVNLPAQSVSVIV
ncbi:MAG: hypothetical protein C5B55_00520, partial [Blastocatellia bacterium]